MANNVLPVRMGEIVRAYVLGRLEKISKSTSFATVVIERLFDAFTVLALMLVVLLFVKLPPGNADFKHGLHVAGYISLGLYSLTFLLMFAIKRNPDRFISLLSAVLRPLSPRVSAGIISPIHRFRQGLLVIDRVPVFVVSSLYSLAIWAAFGYSIYLAGLAFGIQLGPSATLLILVAICLAMMMPSAPGFVGTYHAAVTYALIMYGISSENAAAFSVVFHAVNYIPLTLTGFLCLWKYQLSLRALRETTEGDR